MAVNALSRTKTVAGYKCTSTLYFENGTRIIGAFTAAVQDYEQQLPDEALSCSFYGNVYEREEGRVVQVLSGSGTSSCSDNRNVAELYVDYAQTNYWFLQSLVNTLKVYY
jgi:hypothetical protein